MKTLSAVESFTGGLFAKMITDTPGASKYFKGSLIAYSNEIKEKLQIDTSNGVVSKDIALQMSQKGKEFFNSDICVSFTGEAGPIANEKTVGLIFICINENVYEFNWPNLSREQIRIQAVEFAIKKIKKLL